ncbi:MAG: hypothetical protein OK442_07490, partial [Thaumarchaeota archaeon]|nr:hypothetical protein [Nitrososphaerota archaeon]
MTRIQRSNPGKLLLAAFVAVALSIPTAAVFASTAGGQGTGSPNLFDHPGNLLITDQFNNRVIEVNPRTNAIVWSFGSNNPALCNPGSGAVIGPNDAERLAFGLTVIAGTGIPPGASSAIPNGCVDNRVIVVDKAGQIVWQY